MGRRGGYLYRRDERNNPAYWPWMLGLNQLLDVVVGPVLNEVNATDRVEFKADRAFKREGIIAQRITT